MNIAIDTSYYRTIILAALFSGFCWHIIYSLMGDALQKEADIRLRDGFKIIIYAAVIAVIGATFFFAVKKTGDKPADFGAERTEQESMDFEPPSAEEIGDLNRKALIEEERALDEDMKEEKKRSREEYEKALEKALENQ